MNAKEFYINQGRKSFSNTNNPENVNLVDVWLFAERYHESRLKLLGIADVVGQSEQLFCENVIHHTCIYFNDVIGCTDCQVKKFKAK